MMKISRWNIFALVLTALVAAGILIPRRHIVNQEAALIPIQHNGRIKSFDAFARETLRLIAGKETWEKQPAWAFILSHLAEPQNFLDAPFIRVDHLDLKRAMGLPRGEKYFSYNQLKSSFPVMLTILQTVQEKRGREIRLNSMEQNAELLYSRLITVDQLTATDIIKVVPQAEQGQNWQSPYWTAAPLSEAFKKLAVLYAQNPSADMSAQIQGWISEVKKSAGTSFAAGILLERYYYQVKPFFYAWLFYVAAFMLLMYAQAQQKAQFQFGGISLLALGFLFHSAGLLLRAFILHRPPVSNMFESMIFMNWILMVCALAFYAVRREAFFLTGGALLSALIMIFADLLPIEKSLDVLAPVLKSNYWLTVHVLTIVASYGVFGLAMALGHRHLFLNALGRLSMESEKVSAHGILRLLQVGLITLGIGTVLGGVWANESWGRFWGWDPKETWALITFLGYLIVIHLRMGNRLDNFALALCAIVGFLLVLMTWYGVNFILGRGLHSYGFGAGGAAWVAAYLMFEGVFLGFIFLARVNFFQLKRRMV